jgi:hypothetical protein
MVWPFQVAFCIHQAKTSPDLGADTGNEIDKQQEQAQIEPPDIEDIVDTEFDDSVTGYGSEGIDVFCIFKVLRDNDTD